LAPLSRSRNISPSPALELHVVTIAEVSEAGSVRPILLVDWEELVGAKQNRVLNLSILLPPRRLTDIPVSCVEQGRWHYRGRHFTQSPASSLPKHAPERSEREEVHVDQDDAGLAQFERGVVRRPVESVDIGGVAGELDVLVEAGREGDFPDLLQKGDLGLVVEKGQPLVVAGSVEWRTPEQLRLANGLWPLSRTGRHTIKCIDIELAYC
jgi:hypothetical protein